MRYADLHVHTNYSDGTFTPREVVRTAHEKKLSCIAVCDHDCVDGIDECMRIAEKYSVEIVPGVELTVIKDRREIHVLGYFIDWKEEWFGKILKHIQRQRITRMDKMIEKLRLLDVYVDKNRVMEIAGGHGSVGRLHLARALLESGAVSSIQMAFDKYIADSKPCFVEDIGFSAEEAIRLIIKAKGVPVIAHPGVLKDDLLVEELIKCGIRGIEAYHSDHSPGTSKKYEHMAEKYGLLITGGSDCHGSAKKRILMGSIKVQYETVERLRREADAIRNGRLQ